MNTINMLKISFEMKDMGLDDVILGIKITRTSNDFFFFVGELQMKLFDHNLIMLRM